MEQKTLEQPANLHGENKWNKVEREKNRGMLIRFLMDHIDGDTYYNTYYPGQNLDRARTQLKLVEDMEKKLPQIKQILRNIYKELGLKVQIN